MIRTTLGVTPRPVHASVDELLADTERIGDFVPADARSQARFERVEVDGEPCIVKYVHAEYDFALRALGGRGDLALRAWQAGLMDSAPDAVDHATLGAAPWGPDGTGCALLMRDVSSELIPAVDEPISEEEHLGFMADMAAFCASNWGFEDRFDLLTPGSRWEMFSATAIAEEAALGFPEPVPRIALGGWARFAERAPASLVGVVDELRNDARPLAAAVARTPITLLHGDWKMGNLGRSMGRTILIDWCYVGPGPAAEELVWYLALNRRRLPAGHTKESSIEDFAAGLTARGIELGSWWEAQLGLCMVGALVQFGWEKALGSDRELNWWCDRAREGLRWL